jgi:hypothetical protein
MDEYLKLAVWLGVLQGVLWVFAKRLPTHLGQIIYNGLSLDV